MVMPTREFGFFSLFPNLFSVCMSRFLFLDKVLVPEEVGLNLAVCSSPVK